MSYLNSEDIQVFPSTKRGHKQVSARLMSEKSLVNIINRLVDKEGFIITPKITDETSEYYDLGYDPNGPLEFNLFGYYFKVSKIQDILNLFALTSARTIYANIILDTTGNYLELLGQDDEEHAQSDASNLTSVYEGVSFTNGKIDPTTERPIVYNLLLFSRESAVSDWFIPDSSRIKFMVNSLEFEVDGGEI